MQLGTGQDPPLYQENLAVIWAFSLRLAAVVNLVPPSFVLLWRHGHGPFDGLPTKAFARHTVINHNLRGQCMERRNPRSGLGLFPKSPEQS